MRSLIVSLMSVVVVLTLSVAQAQTVEGEATVIDGDTLSINGEQVRLYGIDAPEADQTCWLGGDPWPCGEYAASRLDALISGYAVQCELIGIDRYGRLAGLCQAGENTDLAAALVNEGSALAQNNVTEDYVGYETAAMGGRYGIWQGTFYPPWEWRGMTAEQRARAPD